MQNPSRGEVGEGARYGILREGETPLSYSGTWYFGHIICEMSPRSRYEQLTYHHDLLRFHTDLVERAKGAARGFRDIFSEYFRLAAYPELLGDLDPGEISLAAELGKNGRPEHDVIWQVINYRMFRQVRAIARGTARMEGIEAWVGLFNRFMRCGVARVRTDPPCLRIYCAETEPFAPYFCDHVASRLAGDKPCSPLFEDLRQVMDKLRRVSLRRAAFDQASLDQLLQWVGRYGETVRQEGKG